MQLIRGEHNLHNAHHGTVATIGNFDGMHLGHQSIITQLQGLAEQYRVPATLIVFEPHPKEFFGKAPDVARLSRLREKILLAERYGIDRILCLHFDTRLAECPAEDFIRQTLVDKLRVKALVVGADFRFGQGRRGDVAMLESASRQYGFSLHEANKVEQEGRRVSSTWVRACLAGGDLSGAKKLLGRHYSMCGRIAHGDKRGRDIGFPTANIFLHRKKSPLYGVYAVKMYGLNESAYCGVANLGNRPTVDGTRTLLEVHLFDFDRDVYGEYVRVEFCAKIRDEKRFDSFDELKAQIALDVKRARAEFKMMEKQHG